MRYDAILAGVGGQGTLSVGHILVQSAVEEGHQVIASETHGMSQRGGSVIFHYRLGEISASLVPKGQSELILSGEPMEALRFLDFLKPNGTVVTSDHGMLSPVAAQGGATYPALDEVWKAIKEWPAKLYVVSANKIASELGAPLAGNMVLLGAAAGLEALPMK